MSEIVYWFLSSGVCVVGLGTSLWYLWASRPGQVQRSSPLAGKRPWRRWGAAVCGLVSVLFYVGLHHLDPARRPRTFLAVWIVILLLVICLCVLALVDILYTRRLLRKTLRRPEDTP